MHEKRSKTARLSGESKTLIGIICFLTLMFIWLDLRHESHEEISAAECKSLNTRWEEVYRETFSMGGALDISSFDCPSAVSGLARGLRLLETIGGSMSDADHSFNFWQLLTEVRPILGDQSGLGLVGTARYEENRIDINTMILKRGDPVEIAGILVHEARHLQQGYNSHVPCLRLENASCDVRLEQNPENGGAYNYNVLFYDHVLKHSGATAQDKRAASSQLLNVLDKRFNAVKPELRKRYEP